MTSLLDQLKKTETARNQEDNFRAALKKINNIYRDDLLQRLLRGDTALNSNVLSFFIGEQAQDVSVVYQHLPCFYGTEAILSQYAEQRKCDWLKCFNTVNSTSTTDKAVAEIIQLAKVICAPVNQWSSSIDIGQHVQQTQHKTQKEQKQINEWQEVQSNLHTLDTGWIADYKKNKSTLISMSAVLKQEQVFSAASWQVHANLYCSPNFVYTHKMEHRFYGSYTKPALVLLYVLQQEEVDGILICMEEVAAVQKY